MTESEIFAKILIDGELTEGPIVAGDYTLGVRDIEGGHQLIITKGGQVQTLDVLDGIGAVQSVNGQTGAVVLDADDVGALPNSTEIPEALADLTEDSTHRVVTDVEKTEWNAKQNAIDDLTAIRSGAAKGETAVQDSDLAAVAKSGNYNDLSNKPNIPSAVTEQTVSGWGFTKNTGNYSKPSDGIPKTDFDSSVQASLEKADSALQGTDTTLAVSGKAADAKATRDAIDEVKDAYAELKRGNGAPTVEARNGSLYFDELSGRLYKRVSGGWVDTESTKHHIATRHGTTDIIRTGDLIEVSTESSATVTVYGENLLNKDHISVSGIKNDSGEDVSDPNSRYFTDMIPVIPGETLYVNFGAQRFYMYDSNRVWIGRTSESSNSFLSAYGEYTVPLGCSFIQVQVQINRSYNLDYAMITKKEFYERNRLLTGRIKNGIKNDSGQDISDSSSYYIDKIAVTPGETIYLNFGAQRIYQYGVDGAWLRRTEAAQNISTRQYGLFVVPADCYSIQIQFRQNESVNISNAEVISYEWPEKYITFTKAEYNVSGFGDNIVLNADYSRYRIYSDVDYSLYEYSITDQGIVEGCSKYPIWEPRFTTNDFSTPMGYDNVALSNFNYYNLIDAYYDQYLGKYDRFKFSKRSIGIDSSGDYELYEYEYTPENYSRTVMLSAGMNPCELSTIFGLAYFVKAVLVDYANDAGLTYIHNHVRLKIIPVIYPNGFNQSPISYTNANDVRINKNFNYLGGWYEITGEPKGDAPDDQPETKILKRWVNDNANADLWIDCHSDVGGNTPSLNWTCVSDEHIQPIVRNVQHEIHDFYVEKGVLDPEEQTSTIAGIASKTNYPKTLYAWHIAGIHAIMIEQYPNSTYYGSDGSTNNDDAGIKNYTMMIRAYILACLASSDQSVN